LKVSFLSDDYFALASARPELAAAFALGQRVIALADGVAYEVVGREEPSDPISLPPTYTPPPPDANPPSVRPTSERPSEPEPTRERSMPCPASGLLIGLAALPLCLRRGKAHG
jgi:hypothetical protein